MRRHLKQGIICILVILLALSLGGCRESLVLIKILHNQQAETVDRQNDTKLKKNTRRSDVEDQNLTKKKESANKRQGGTRKTASTLGSQKNEGKASRTKQDSTSTNNKKSDTKPTGDGQNKGKHKHGKNGSENTPSGRSGGPAKPSEDGDAAQGDAGDTDDNQIRNVKSVVAADASTAMLVQMLGGKGELVGTSAETRENNLAATFFADEGWSSVKTYWNGDGTSSSDMSSSQFNALMKAKPELVIYQNGENTFSDAQIKKMKNAGIKIHALHQFNTEDHIISNVETVGRWLGTSTAGGLNARKLARSYKSYCKDLDQDVCNDCHGYFSWNNWDFSSDYSDVGKNVTQSTYKTAGSGIYSLYISGWDSAALSLRSGSKVVYRENGTAVAVNGYSDAPISHYMSLAGVCNNGARFSPSKAGGCYVATPFNLNLVKPSLSGTAYGEQFYRTTAHNSSSESFARVNDGSGTNGEGIGLGQKRFPRIIVDSRSTRDALLASPQWRYYPYKKIGSASDFYVSYNGSYSKALTSYMRANIQNENDVLVNPYGAASWADGSAESVLESVWVGSEVRKNPTCERKLKSTMRDFYSQFYRHDCSDSTLNEILRGRQ